MSNVQIFIYKDRLVRTVDINGEIWWVMRDVFGALGPDSCTSDISRRIHDGDGVKHFELTDEFGRKSNTYIINESALFIALFFLGTDEARYFRNWVTSKVLPAIRGCGVYSTQNVIVFPKII